VTKKAEEGKSVATLEADWSLGGLLTNALRSFVDFLLDLDLRRLGVSLIAFCASALIFWIDREIAFFRFSAS